MGGCHLETSGFMQRHMLDAGGGGGGSGGGVVSAVTNGCTLPLTASIMTYYCAVLSFNVIVENGWHRERTWPLWLCASRIYASSQLASQDPYSTTILYKTGLDQSTTFP